MLLLWGDTGGMLAAWFRMKYPNILDGMPAVAPERLSLQPTAALRLLAHLFASIRCSTEPV